MSTPELGTPPPTGPLPVPIPSGSFTKGGDNGFRLTSLPQRMTTEMSRLSALNGNSTPSKLVDETSTPTPTPTDGEYGSVGAVKELPWNASPVDYKAKTPDYSNNDFKAEDFPTFAQPLPPFNAVALEGMTPMVDSPTIPDYFAASRAYGSRVSFSNSTTNPAHHQTQSLSGSPNGRKASLMYQQLQDNNVAPTNGIVRPSHGRTQSLSLGIGNPLTPVVEPVALAKEALESTKPPFTETGGRARSFSRARSMSYLKVQAPVLPDILVSAPGKVIVYGEHAVVHGKAAIAAALSLRAFLHIQHLPRKEGTVTLVFPDINLDHTWRIEDLPWDVFHAPEKRRTYFEKTVDKLDDELTQALEPSILGIAPDQRSCVICFLYLYMCLGSRHSPASIFTLRSQIPIGAGLGSSASISVSLSTALQLQSGTLVRPSESMSEEEREQQHKKINDWAFVGEMCIHGNPSGVDNAVATGGKAVLFRRRDYGKPPDVRRLENFPTLPLLLVNTNQSRRTADLVGAVHSLKNSHPTTTMLMLDAIDNVTAEALIMLDNKHFRPDESHLLRLGELVRINHGLLVALGVSHPKLERIRQLVDGTGIGWTKLTGAGGGGCAITILRPNLRDGELRELEGAIEREGFTKYESTLGGDGVGVLWPAMNGKTEISREIFLAAEKGEGLETLVGVPSVGTGRTGWGFWREWSPEEA